MPPPPDLTIGGANPATDCECLLPAALPVCLTGIRFLTAELLADVVFHIEDKWGHRHPAEATTDADGYATLLVADLPPALFNAYAGYFKIVIVKAGEPFTDWLPFTVNSTDYLCAIVHFANFGAEYGIVSL